MSLGIIIHYPKFHPSRAHHCRATGKTKICQSWTQKLNFSLGVPWYDYSPPKVSSKSGSPLQSYRKDKIMATLNSKNQTRHKASNGMGMRLYVPSFLLDNLTAKLMRLKRFFFERHTTIHRTVLTYTGTVVRSFEYWLTRSLLPTYILWILIYVRTHPRH